MVSALFDYDTVTLANMNRLFFRPEHVGLPKTDAAVSVISAINPDVRIETYPVNITTIQGFNTFKSKLVGPDGNSRVDLVLACVDNYEARIHINRACLELRQTWMESGVSEDAMSGALLPGAAALALSCHAAAKLLRKARKR